MTNAPAASMVVYDGVSKFFPVRLRSVGSDQPELMVALDRINATVRKGELVTLLGPSGCGKTTLLRLTAGLIGADEGHITIAGVPVTGARKDACMVLQNFGLLPSRTVPTVIFLTHSIDEVLILSDRIFVFDTAAGRLRAIVDSPVAGGRLSGDIRTHPDFGKSRAELRDMLRSEP